MSLTLENFDSFVDPKIEERGYNYFAGAAVVYLEEIRSGLWNADVEGSELYQVQIKLNRQVVEYTSCDCLYDYGPVCKHIVATLYALRMKLLKNESFPEKTEIRSGKKKSGRKTVAQQIEETLDHLQPEQVRQFLQETLENDRELRTVFISRFTTADEMKDTSGIRRKIKSILAPAKRKGLVYPGESRGYLAGVQELIQKAEREVKQENAAPAISMCIIIIEELVPALQYIDDSDGSLGGLIAWAFDILDQTAGQDLDESVRKAFLKDCLEQSEKEQYTGWDYDQQFTDLAAELTETPEEIELLEQQLMDRMEQSRHRKRLDRMSSEEHTYIDTYSLEQYAKQLLHLYKKSGQQAKYQELLQQNRNLPDIMTELIGQAWQQQDYDEVRSLSNEALKEFEDKPGLNKQWLEWLLKVAEVEQDTERQHTYTRRLLLDTRSMDWYKELKKLYSEDEWPAVSEELLETFKDQGRFWISSIYADICVEEERWKELLEHVRLQSGFSALQHYDSWLKDHYFDELMDLYEIRLLEFMEQNTGRSYYKETCRVLHRMQALGGVVTVNKVVEILQQEYSIRPALQDELRKAGFV